MPIPETTVGAGDDAYALDYDHNGLMDFLVLNGGRVDLPGPVELIAFFPSPPPVGRAGAGAASPVLVRTPHGRAASDRARP